MSNVVPFRRSPSPPPPVWGEDRAPELSAAARRLVAARGTSAGRELRRAAGFAGLDATTAARLLAIAEEIERIDLQTTPNESGPAPRP